MKTICFILSVMFVAAFAFAAPTAPQPSTADQIKKLVAVLKSDAGQKEKADACRELARIGDQQAVAPLAALLPDEKLSHMARYGLETIPGSAVDKALRKAATQLQGRQLVGVIGSIGVRRDPKAVKLLARLLESRDREVVQAAARSLGSIGTEAAADALLKALPMVTPANQLAFCEGLLRCAETAEAQGEHEDAIEIYDRLRQVPAPHQVQTAALRGAILNRGEAGLPLLALALNSDSFSMVIAAARIAQEMPGPAVTRLIASDLPGQSADRQILLIQTLGLRKDDTALPALYAAARSGEAVVRVEAIRAVAELGSPSATPVLIELMGDADKKVAQAARDSLASIPGKEVDSAIMKLLQNGTSAQRLAAMDLVVRRRIMGAIPTLFAMASGNDATMGVAALGKLGEIGGPDEVPGLMKLLAKTSDAAGLEAVEQALVAASLKGAGPVASAKLVQTGLSSAAPAQKCVLLRVLGAVGSTNALAAVRAAVDDSNADVHAVATRVLAGWATPDAAEAIFVVAKAANNPADRMLCLRGYLRLAALPEISLDRRLTMCREAAPLAQKDDEKKLLLGALGSIVALEALDLVLPYLQDAGVREEAAIAAIAIADKLAQGPNSEKVSPKLVLPMEKVALAVGTGDLAKRARDLSDKARIKAGGK